MSGDAYENSLRQCDQNFIGENYRNTNHIDATFVILLRQVWCNQGCKALARLDKLSWLNREDLIFFSVDTNKNEYEIYK